MAATLTWSDLRFEAPIGAGQAGEVWRAHLVRDFRDLASGSVVAVKRYKRWVMEQPGQYERMYRELALGMRVSHPNVVTAYCLVNSPENLPCLVMRYYDGVTLDSLLQRQRESHQIISLPDAFRLLRGIAGGILALHAQGALHRDVKPANILVGVDGEPVLMDLGFVTETVLPEHTRTEQFLGTIRYAHPDYLMGLRCGPESDAYSLGAMAYEVLSGERFLGAEGNWATLVARIVARRSPVVADISRICQTLALRHGQWAGEAFYWVTESLLRRPTHATLQHFVAAVHAQFWQHPFSDAPGGVTLGAPDGLEGRGRSKWPFMAADTVWTIEAMQHELFENFSSSDIAALKRLLGARYWDWRCRLNAGDLDANEIGDIEVDLSYFLHMNETFRGWHEQAGTDDSALVTVAEALLMLYRFDLITESRE